MHIRGFPYACIKHSWRNYSLHHSSGGLASNTLPIMGGPPCSFWGNTRNHFCAGSPLPWASCILIDVWCESSLSCVCGTKWSSGFVDLLCCGGCKCQHFYRLQDSAIPFPVLLCSDCRSSGANPECGQLSWVWGKAVATCLQCKCGWSNHCCWIGHSQGLEISNSARNSCRYIWCCNCDFHLHLSGSHCIEVLVKIWGAWTPSSPTFLCVFSFILIPSWNHSKA